VLVDKPSPEGLAITAALEAIGWKHSFATCQDAASEVRRRRPHVVIITAHDGVAASEIDCLRRLRADFPDPKFLFLAAMSSEDLAIAAFHSGTHHYIKAPWTPPVLQSAVIGLLPSGTFADQVGVAPLKGGDRLVGRSPAIRQLGEYLARIAPVKSNVLVRGETGTGKELVAELIHLNSRRAERPLLCLNTAAIPDALLENELFGHERGAFTGATSSQSGKLAAAHGGTVFLDEIGDVSLAIQAKLLRVIDGKSVYRLGGTHRVDVDVRIIAATNDDLERSVQEGRFRKDLYYRLNVVRVDLAPLRERVLDIPPLIDHYLKQFCREIGSSVRGLSARAIETLCAYQWPGNVRELRNFIEALLVNLSPDTNGVVDIPPQVLQQLARGLGAPESERDRLLHALTATNWNKSKAAHELHCSRMTLYRKLQRYKLDVPG
jgi:DNA-binding NtrC family response regulator